MSACLTSKEQSVYRAPKSPIPHGSLLFLENTLADASAWVRGIPKPPKAVNKRYFVVLKREIFEKQGRVIICKALDGEKEPQAILYKIQELGMWITSYNRHCWEQDYENYEERYQ